jgi:prepilin-type N-terminal cleavage/methylation domain-containing protein/prepilin-type processing-associated H-X9-DG protein
MQLELQPVRLGRRHVTQRAFTMVELLVVVAVVAVLAALGLLVVPRALERARAAACLGNLRQIGLLMHGYAAEHGGYFPPGGNPEGYIRRLCRHAFAGTYADTGGPPDAPLFETGPARFFICPSDQDGLRNLHKSYLVNGKIAGVAVEGGGWLNPSYEPKPIAAIKDPARTFLIIEDWRRDSKLWRGNDVRYRPVSAPDDFHAHGEGRHYLYVDNHVELLTTDPGREEDGFATFYRGE